MLQNHFVKMRPKGGKRVEGVLASNMLNMMPTNRLFTLDDAIAVVEERLRYHPEEKGELPTNKRGVHDVLENLAKQGFIKEFVGVTLEKTLGM